MPFTVRFDGDVCEHDAAAFVHRGVEPVRRLERSEGHGQMKVGIGLSNSPLSRIDAARNVTRDSHDRFVHQLGKQRLTSSSSPRERPVPKSASMTSGAPRCRKRALRHPRSIAIEPILLRRSSARLRPRPGPGRRARRAGALRHNRRRRYFRVHTGSARTAAQRSDRPPQQVQRPLAPSAVQRSCPHRSTPVRPRASVRLRGSVGQRSLQGASNAGRSPDATIPAERARPRCHAPASLPNKAKQVAPDPDMRTM